MSAAVSDQFFGKRGEPRVSRIPGLSDSGKSFLVREQLSQPAANGGRSRGLVSEFESGAAL